MTQHDDHTGLPGEPGQPPRGPLGGKGGKGGRGGRGAVGKTGEAGAAGEVSTASLHAAIRGYQRRALTGFLILLLGIGVVTKLDSDRGAAAREAIVDSGRAVAVLGCNRDFRTQQQVRGVLEASITRSQRRLEAGEITPNEHARQEEFLRAQLAQLPLPDCRLATITDDPNEEVMVPEPLHPGHPDE